MSMSQRGPYHTYPRIEILVILLAPLGMVENAQDRCQAIIDKISIFFQLILRTHQFFCLTPML